MYRSIDNGLRAMDVRTLTEAAESLGANSFTILFRIILPNLRTALLSGALLTFSIVVASLPLPPFLVGLPLALTWPCLGAHRALRPAALTIVSFALTWAAMILIQFVTRGSSQSQIAAGASPTPRGPHGISRINQCSQGFC